MKGTSMRASLKRRLALGLAAAGLLLGVAVGIGHDASAATVQVSPNGISWCQRC
jgi:hypothetical protein